MNVREMRGPIDKKAGQGKHHAFGSTAARTSRSLRQMTDDGACGYGGSRAEHLKQGVMCCLQTDPCNSRQGQ
jgi:hypothetical protein